MTVHEWLSDLRTSALVGTARRDAPPPPPVPGLRPRVQHAGREERLLELAALGDVLVRAGRRPAHQDAPLPTAPEETVPAAGDRASQLLTLLLLQPPMGKALRDELVVEWLTRAAQHPVHVPSPLLVPLLDLAAARPEVARALFPAAGERGRWLTGLNPAWAGLASATGSPPRDEELAAAWTTLPIREATEELGRLRAHDPAAARDLLSQTWDSLAARERRAHLGVLRVGLGPADEPLLELGLDDSAKSVRDEAASLLDLVPSSARATRMAARLRPLITRHGTLRRSLRVEVPDEPDPMAIRDGLAPPPRSGEPDRLGWLRTIVRGAPLTVWTELADGPPERAVAQLRDEPGVLQLIRQVVLLRRDATWAAALLEVEHDDALVTLLPPAEREQRILTAIETGTATEKLARLHAAVSGLPRPWGDVFAHRVLALLAGNDGGKAVHQLAPLLPSALPPGVLPAARAAIERLEPGDRRRDVLARVVQYHSFRHTLTEAFR
ncbi:DUF5691 domain-containing protein [Nocardioides sp.]|uniref:DUF5691 domain-containing protein n=1 Tax=Nocardioides sp. TaxID=35761 RepID=UPI002ED4B9B1